MTKPGCHITGKQLASLVPRWLQAELRLLLSELGGPLYLAGGVVRDLLLAKKPADIDCTVVCGARIWAQRLAEHTGGAYVPLGREEDAARVVRGGLSVDFSAFRLGAATIEADLGLRDLSCNAMAVQIDHWLVNPSDTDQLALLDPIGGLPDLQTRLIRAAAESCFTDDPLRLLRAFRFAATLGFAIEQSTFARIREQRRLIVQPAPERITHELDAIMSSGNAWTTVRSMAQSGLLWELIPELVAGVDMEQPQSHHLDVFGHSLEALKQMERILASPGSWFQTGAAELQMYGGSSHMRTRLCWAALLHDLGKPPTYMRRADKDNRITFYHHDHVGASMVAELAVRFRWSNDDREYISSLVKHHMRPFFLANVVRDGQLTLRASIRLLRKMGTRLPGLFLLAMADSLAGKGEKSVAGMEEELSALYSHLQAVHRDHVAPVVKAKALVNGHDLIAQLGLTPGPLFKQILRRIEEAQMEGRVHSKEQGLQLAIDIASAIQRDE
ncbi:HD domain-containing protein [Desulfobulbus rhabdoformis]|uniref:CCA tRNA nucleotidyltransferase n=1 Tax=Desulfobulbus rhabdoformis TaxID=34032 RepID=UPI0019664165|nr:HD domain-containing protein [Desulfobulbus rhabdoformis]MBM9613284.1 HD domain-containing protein [Desulfobulbus rhabdoformis]